jgi:DNA-binding beta-propeller fold protein YncE
VEVTSGGSASALSITISSGSSTFSAPQGVAVDTTGSLYVADSANNRIVKVAAGSTTGSVVSIARLGTALNTPCGVAVDRIGNIFIADENNNRIAAIDMPGNGRSRVFLRSTTFLRNQTRIQVSDRVRRRRGLWYYRSEVERTSDHH